MAEAGRGPAAGATRPDPAGGTGAAYAELRDLPLQSRVAGRELLLLGVKPAVLFQRRRDGGLLAAILVRQHRHAALHLLLQSKRRV